MLYRKLPRLVVTLIYKNGAFFNSRGFRDYDYLGDPINIIQLLNSKNCMEAAILNISDDPVDFEEFRILASEAFMPLSYGGGISNIEDAAKIISIGYEKIVLKDTEIGLSLAQEIATKFGSQAVCVCVNINDNRRNRWSIFNSRLKRGSHVTDMAERLERIINVKPGEILIQDVSRDGCECGLNTSILADLEHIKIPILLSGGSTGFNEVLRINKEYTNLNFAGTTSYTFKNGGKLVNYPSTSELYLLKQN